MSEFIKCKNCKFEMKYYGFCYECEVIELKDKNEKLKSQLKDAENFIEDACNCCGMSNKYQHCDYHKKHPRTRNEN